MSYQRWKLLMHVGEEVAGAVCWINLTHGSETASGHWTEQSKGSATWAWIS